MANVNHPFGFTPIRVLGGGDDLATNIWDLAPTAGEIAEGDLLERRTDGYVWPAQAGSVTIVGTATANIPANTGGFVSVTDPTSTVYLAQMDDGSCAVQADLHYNYNIIASVPVGGKSTMAIDASTKADTATLPIKILKRAFISGVNQSEFGNYCVVECMINNHLLKSTGVIG